MQSILSPSTTPIPGEYWQWQGHKIYYVKAGERKNHLPTLLLVHGFGASTDHWRKNITELSQDFQVYAIDLLGFGRSEKAKLEYGGNVWCDQLHDFICEVIKSEVIIAGNSLGGYASLSVAAQYPDMFKGLVLLNSAGPFTEQESTAKAVTPSPAQKIFGDSIKWLFQQPFTQFLLFQYLKQPWVIRRTLEKVYADKSAITSQLVEEIRRPACDEGAFDVFSSVFKTPQGEKVDVLLKKLTCPLLLLWGEKDPWVNARQRSMKFKKHYLELTEYFLDAGHCPHDEIPTKVNSLLRDWIWSINPQSVSK
ncbi:MAG: alpha/beta fold hydrolase [Cyanobacteria bacterium P01_A01_bin.84]